MKLLFDQQLSRRVVRSLKDIYPEARHVSFFQLQFATDDEVWDFAKKHDYTIVTKDDDFHQRSLLLGQPPKVIWIQLGNSDNSATECFIRERTDKIESFAQETEASLLVLENKISA